MSQNSSTNSAPTTPENDPNSSIINKVRSRVSNILPTSLSKWFSSPSGRNGNLRRRRDSESDNESNNDNNYTTTAAAAANVDLRAPPTKRSKLMSTNQASDATSVSTRHFTSSTPTLSVGNRRQFLANTSAPPYTFNPAVNRLSLLNEETLANDNLDEEELAEGADTTDEEIEDTTELPYELLNRKKLNIAPTASMTTTKNIYYPSTSRPNNKLRESYSEQRQIIEENSINNEDDNLQDSVLFNGNANETYGGESSVNRIARAQSEQIRPQSSAGRINTSLVNDDDVEPIRRLSGLFGTGSKRLRPSNSSGLNFSTHLQSHKSLFSDKNMPNSLNNSTTSLTSLNRRQSFNASLYGSTSALSDSRLLNTSSPFYNGRTMYGGASAYSSRRSNQQRTLRVPTQIRPSSSLSTLGSSNNSNASAAATSELTTPALSNTAKRILDLMNQFTTPLAEVKKMANATNVPALVSNRRRFDETDMLYNRSIRMSSPKTPYTRPNNQVKRISPITSELQVPSMSQLLQMKKILQNNTEKVRELASGSSSILNRTDDYKLPENSSSSNSTARSTNKIKNKLSSTARVKKATNTDTETVEPVNLPNIQLPFMKAMPAIDIAIPKQKPSINIDKTNNNEPLVSATPKTISKPSMLNNKESAKKVCTATAAPPVESINQFKFSTPTNVVSPSFAKNVAPINNFKFSEPINVNSDEFKTANSLMFTATSSSSTKTNLDNSNKKVDCKLNNNTIKSPLPLIKGGSVLDALKKNTEIKATTLGAAKPIDKIAPVAATTTSTQSLSSLFKTNSSNKWQCSCCMIQNDNAVEKCVACETPRQKAQPTRTAAAASAPIIPITNSFGSQFKTAASTWECGACMVPNKSDATKCVCCESPKLNSSGAAPAAAATSSSISLPSVPVDQGFKKIVAQQSAKWECSACMTRNDAQRKKCECCEQDKPGASSGGADSSSSSSSFSFSSSATGPAAATSSQFKFGVPFNANATPTVPLLPAASATSSEVKTTFSFGIKPIDNVAAVAPAISFGLPKADDKSEKAATFSFGVKPAAAAAVAPKTDTTDSSSKTTVDKNESVVQSTDLFKLAPTSKPIETIGISAKPTTNTFTFGNTTTKSTTIGESNGFKFGAAATTSSFGGTTSVAAPTTTTAAATFAVETKAPTFSFGASSSSTSLLSNATSEKSSTISPFSSGDLSSTAGAFSTVSSFGNAAAAATTTPSPFGAANIKPAATFAFGSTANKSERVGGFSFSTEDKPSTAAPVFGANTMPALSKSNVTPTLSFGASNVTPVASTAAAAVTSNNSATAFIFGSPSTSSPVSQAVAPTTATFGSTNTSIKPSAGFFSPSNSTTSNAFGNIANSSIFTPAMPTEITPSPLSEPNKNTFVFQPTSTVTPTFGQSATPAFGQQQQGSNASSLPSFGSFGSSAASTQSSFGTPSSAFGTPAATNNNAAGSTFGSPSMFGSHNSAAAAVPSFGSASSGFGTFGGSPSFGAAAAPSGFGQHVAPPLTDEPLSKKIAPGFNSDSNTQKPQAFAFGATNNNNAVEAKTAFNFSATAAPSFNFTGNNNIQQTSSLQPYTFGASSSPNLGIFNFGVGGSQEAAPNTPFQFAADATNNPFAPQPTATNTNAAQQRRRIRAIRRTTPR